jgi:hypothetical protein
MTDWDPNLFREPEFGGGDEDYDAQQPAEQPLELPLEMFFAEDRGAPEAVAACESLASDVLGRVEASRGFVSAGGRRLVRLGRLAAGVAALGLLISAAVADRLGVAPWSETPTEGPVANLVSSASERTAGDVERVREIRDGLLRVVTIRPSAEVAGAVEQRVMDLTGDEPELISVVVRPASDRERSMRGELVHAGPYLSAEGLASGEQGRSAVIRFEDGFSMPVMTGESRAVLRWPASRDVTSSMVSLDGCSSQTTPRSLSPAWYARSGSDRSR